MVVVLLDHVAQRPAAHLLEDVVADAAAAPGNLLPHEDAESIAELKHATRLLVVGEANEVGSHLFDELHLLLDEVIGHPGRVTGVVFVAMGSAKEKAFAIKLERSMLDPLGMTYPEGLAGRVLAACSW